MGILGVAQMPAPYSLPFLIHPPVVVTCFCDNVSHTQITKFILQLRAPFFMMEFAWLGAVAAVKARLNNKTTGDIYA